MADEAALHRCVTKFMIDTCQYSKTEYATFIPFVHLLGRVVMTDVIGDVEWFVSGSSAEFRIKPTLSCIGDIDIMTVLNEYLVIPHGYTLPTELPRHFESAVLVFEIIDSHQPGYVYLEPSYVLRKTDNSRYIAKRLINDRGVLFDTCNTVQTTVQINSHFYNTNMNHEIQENTSIQSLLTPSGTPHGPAINAESNSHFNNIYTSKHRSLSLSSMDYVPCIRCFPWPPQAISWPIRYRYHGWPDIPTINMIVSNGCDVVGAVHPRCKQHEWMSKYQWRLSFSRAEVTLINSWTPVQQIVYHMLRFVMKRTVLSEDSDPNMPKLSNYHIKTLMLWECEQKPQSWWSAESSLVKLCSTLLHKLSGWVNHKNCQHYFINSCNLVDYFVDDFSSRMISNSLRSLADESTLLSWFVENYVRKCAECCPTEVALLFQDIWSSDKLERAAQAVVDWKWNTQRK